MNEGILSKYVQKRPDDPGTTDVENLEFDECGAFGWLRGARDRSIMLELRKKNGNVKAVGYGWLQEADFDASIGITLAVPGRRIVIVGRNLNVEILPNVRLYQGLLRQRVSFVQEADEAAWMRAADGDVVIERIDW